MTSGNPDLPSKLAAPTKKSIFERQKAEAEAKKAREKAETAAVLEDFVKSFDDDDGNRSTFPARRGAFGGGSAPANNFGPGPGKRHFTSSGLKSGPGSLGPSPSQSKSGPGSLGSTPSFGKKRHHDDYSGGRDGDQDRARDRDRRDRIFSYDDRERAHRKDGSFSAEDDEGKDADEIKAAAKPTLHLSSIPPGTSVAVIKGLFAASPLTVDNVRVLPAPTAPTSDRKSISAIVTLAAETPATDIDTVVSHLQNQYLGFGFNLSISRHLSSAALAASNPLNALSANLNNLPFGAKPIPQHRSLSRAPPPGQGPGRFAPPASYTSSTPYGPRSNIPPTQVTVHTPNDLKQLRLIHKTLEALLVYGPEFEALLMSRPEIQRDEQWSWLWDSRSTGGVYYRWRLWEILTNAKSQNKRRQLSSYGAIRPPGDTLFEGQSIWVPPEENLKFEYTTKLEDFVSDEDYNSSDEEDADEGGGLARRYQDHQKLGGRNAPDASSAADVDGAGYLNPLAKTKLVHLLARLPKSNATLRRGDVARVTGFAIEHAGSGAEEVAALVTRNVIQPFCYNVTRQEAPPANSNSTYDEDGPSHFERERERDADEVKGAGTGTGTGTPADGREADGNEEPRNNGDGSGSGSSSLKDTTPASLLGLYIISDILSSSASAGVRHAWRYRSLFETKLRQQNVFPILGRLPRDLNWGKLKAEKWRRSVQNILALWEGWCVFPGAVHEAFVDGFLNPPLTAKEVAEKEAVEREAAEKEQKDRDREKVSSRWRSVDQHQHQHEESESKNKNKNKNRDHLDLDRRAPTRMLGRDSRDADGDVNMDMDMDMDGRPMGEDGDDDGDDDDDDDGHVLLDDNLDGVPMVDSSDEEGEQDELDEQQDEQTKGGPPQESAGHEHEPEPEPEPAPPHPPQKHESHLQPAALDTLEPEPLKTQHNSDDTQPSQGQGRRVRPRAADFDDMFE
ncbi:hypothetical protein LTR20_010844 [Exophiala xenobiotica]|nr:hypothetical protein LTS13_000084 [Exophiala xenobiotica]KAK5391796.1 hypothetical protein LTR79_010895 [Exophiala xenobiotica]KAK5406455.1 hypothetical protein LTR90_010530 [Exophiala xenobiotica]KAK5453078.1 hypothetical protein LTR20_010844 [Exophiala xenobiotica]KAK5471742.1 hypothetical protein LTR26_010769 [Exophiala xenobiotica]